MKACTVRKRRLRRLNNKRRQRGTALIMVLLAVVVLTVFLTDVQQDATSSFSAALSSRERLKAEYHARSAVNLARLLLAVEPTVRKTVAPMFRILNPKAKVPQIPVWKFADDVLGIYNGGDGAKGFSALTGVDVAAGQNLGLSDGRFELVIIDEGSKINVNTASRPDIISRTHVATQLMGLMAPPQYDMLFGQEDADGQLTDRHTLCGALIDWADSDEELEACDLSAQAKTSAGAEDNIYQSLGMGYFRKNAAFDSLEELRLVRGVGDDFWATFVDPDPSDPQKRLLTVWGEDKINVNTANAQNILALVCANAVEGTELCTNPVMASSFLATLNMVRKAVPFPIFGSGKDFVNTMKGAGMLGPLLSTLGIPPVVFRSESATRDAVSLESKVFSIYAVGVVPTHGGESRVSIHAVVDFRQAKTLNQLKKQLAAVAGGPGNNNGAAAPPNATAGGQLDDQQYAKQLNTNPGGKVIHWRLR